MEIILKRNVLTVFYHTNYVKLLNIDTLKENCVYYRYRIGLMRSSTLVSRENEVFGLKSRKGEFVRKMFGVRIGIIHISDGRLSFTLYVLIELKVLWN